MISDRNVANAFGGKTARACDSCIKKRARWYCAADDAFLCQACDSSVHSANPLARRHERVRLKTASLKSLDVSSNEISVPSWHGGFTRKARTPRHGKPVCQLKIEERIRNNPTQLVPEVGSDEISHEENEEEHLLYRVPVFEPFVAELCTSTTVSNEAGARGLPGGGNDTDQTVADSNGIESKFFPGASQGEDVGYNSHGFIPSARDLADFAADMESLLGRGLENESFGMEELGLMECKEETELEVKGRSLRNGKVKIEEEEAARECHADTDQNNIDMTKDPPFELSFDYDSPATCEEEDEKVVGITGEAALKNSTGKCEDDNGGKKNRKKILLRLNYEAVMTAWASQGSPWTNGHRPDFDPDEYWPEWMGPQLHHPYGDMSGLGLLNPAMVDGGREARVSRYREKRRTRLFSKKIRYEVRKLNAEKRPRMKGRFVKRTNFSPGAGGFPLMSK